MSRLYGSLLGVGLFLLFTIQTGAVQTKITVRVLSKDAKFIGTSMGGARVSIKDADTGELLASGVTQGSTGNTRRIMLQDRKRGIPLSSEGSARFTAVIHLDEPRRIEVSAYGPLGQRQAANTVSSTQWVIPGRHIDEGDAWLLVMPGFAVDVLSPPAHSQHTVDHSISLKANIVMM